MSENEWKKRTTVVRNYLRIKDLRRICIDCRLDRNGKKTHLITRILAAGARGNSDQVSRAVDKVYGEHCRAAVAESVRSQASIRNTVLWLRVSARQCTPLPMHAAPTPQVNVEDGAFRQALKEKMMSTIETADPFWCMVSESHGRVRAPSNA
jgi:hypothetical protein